MRYHQQVARKYLGGVAHGMVRASDEHLCGTRKCQLPEART